MKYFPLNVCHELLKCIINSNLTAIHQQITEMAPAFISQGRSPPKIAKL